MLAKRFDTRDKRWLEIALWLREDIADFKH